MSTFAKKMKDLPYVFYDEMRKNGRAYITRMAKRGNVTRNSATKQLLKCFEQRILFPPQLRMRMTKRLIEYVYLLKVKDPIAFSSFLVSQGKAFYYCLLGGLFNVLFMSYEPVNVEKAEGFEQLILDGIRSNLIVPPVPRQDYTTAFKKIIEKSKGNPIEQSLIDMNLPEGTEWTQELWELYHYLKYDVRVKFPSLIERFHFKTSTFYNRYRQILTLSDIHVPFYPLGESMYSSFYFLFKTEYQHFIMNCFAELPVTSMHFRLRNSLISYVRIPYGSDGTTFFKILSLWQHKGMIDSYELSIPYYSDAFVPQPGSPCPAPPPPISPNGTISERGESSGKMLIFSI